MVLKAKKPIAEPRKANVTVVFAGGNGIQSAYDVLAKILINKKLKEGEQKCGRRSMPG
jgi:hypothetical protein